MTHEINTKMFVCIKGVPNLHINKPTTVKAELHFVTHKNGVDLKNMEKYFNNNCNS